MTSNSVVWWIQTSGQKKVSLTQNTGTHMPHYLKLDQSLELSQDLSKHPNVSNSVHIGVFKESYNQLHCAPGGLAGLRPFKTDWWVLWTREAWAPCSWCANTFLVT